MKTAAVIHGGGFHKLYLTLSDLYIIMNQK